MKKPAPGSGAGARGRRGGVCYGWITIALNGCT
ncbi:hypothetical protein MET9862_03123 [Methylobacterium symbioticum]|uniref:Uncharacterized protein n=1 Tax=Methylobacterium symbioticum TaxID=2584084 RepID=A0A509EH64_9HYPH|nr:hypothetical protein MET9862_03123 [Methylobacterium symbioticum]